MPRFTPPVICNHGFAVDTRISAGTSRMLPARNSTFIAEPHAKGETCLRTTKVICRAACNVVSREPEMGLRSAATFGSPALYLTDTFQGGVFAVFKPKRISQCSTLESCSRHTSKYSDR